MARVNQTPGHGQEKISFVDMQKQNVLYAIMSKQGKNLKVGHKQTSRVINYTTLVRVLQLMEVDSQQQKGVISFLRCDDAIGTNKSWTVRYV